jgi:hypothetical protein
MQLLREGHSCNTGMCVDLTGSQDASGTGIQSLKTNDCRGHCHGRPAEAFTGKTERDTAQRQANSYKREYPGSQAQLPNSEQHWKTSKR